ncbi:hypothetical protein J4410_06310 [Candidatus Woesearchaeota archaeon]|nr:hypothetical protein [Candidatus Woesearchaeota archaeon]
MEEKSSFRLVFGDAPIVKVIDFFLDNREFDYSLTDIAKNSDIGWSTLHLFWKEIVNLGIVVKTRKIGNAELYKLNIANPIVKKLTEIDSAISKRLMQQEMAKQGINKQRLKVVA